MKTVMMPFITIYHIVSKILSFPTNLFKKTGSKVSEDIETARMKSSIKGSYVKSKDKKEEDLEKQKDSNFEGINPQKVKKPVRKLYSFRYVALNENKKKVTGIFDGESVADVKAFFESQGLTVIKAEPKQFYDIELGANARIKSGSLSFSLMQLSTYIRAGIAIVDGVKILARQAHKTNEKKAYERLVYDLLKGENLSDAMEKQGEKFPKLLINMVKTAEMTGDLPTILDDMSEYYAGIDKTKRQMITALTYPAVVLLLAIGVLFFMLIYLVPQFVDLFESQDATLPWITLFVISASDFVKNNFLAMIVGFLIFVIVFYELYKNVKGFRKAIQTVLMHLPVFGNVIIYNEVATFTKTFASLLNHSVYITDSMEVLSKITNNEVYKDIIAKTLSNLGKGDSVSESFKDEWAFPDVAYEMLVTGESTGQLGQMMEKVADHFQNLHENLVNRMKSLIEPIMIIMLAIIVGIILLSIIVPMFDIYGKIK